MTRLTVHTADSAPEGSRGFIDTVITNNGFLPNLIGVLAGAPVALETYLTVSGTNARASLTLQEREVVQITAASVHGCDFCVAGHTAIALKKAGFEKDVVRALQEANRSVPQQIQVITFDNTPISELSTPKLSAVDIDVFQLGRQAANILLSSIEDASNSVQNSLIQVSIVSRESTR